MADRNLSVVLGPRVLGKDAYEAQREQMSKEAGSVGLGAAFDRPFVPNVVEDVEGPQPEPVPVKAVVPGKASVPAAKGKGTAPAKPKSAAGKKNAGPKAVEFSESDAARLLKADPNIWPKILDAEVKRAEGPRLTVATALLEAGGKAANEVMPKEIKAQLKAMLNLDPSAE